MDKKSIIELLGITPIQRIDNPDTMTLLEIREVEKQRNEMLLALIDLVKDKEPLKRDYNLGWNRKLEKQISIIEAACHPLKWSEIKELISAE